MISIPYANSYQVPQRHSIWIALFENEKNNDVKLLYLDIILRQNVLNWSQM